MAIKKVLLGGQLIAVDDETGELAVQVTGLEFDKDIDIGDAHLLDKSDQKINPATTEDIAAIAAAMTGTGLPIPLAVSDPGDDDWSDALTPNPITRDCTRLRMYVGNSGMIVSFDGGVTEHVKLPLNTGDDVSIGIPSGSDVRIKRLTAGTAMTDIIVEVR